ncbi:von Willebrand factor type A domain protein [Thalassoglobus neptunius]|uniref:von Willebrand factor type A domain protein n=1 Tax=Thalassoglobus neptunius TaxID=1938619 RepID=A0A5C5WL74_9PLAN|nr:vWA domain-containing protein [Thalassoglobus neptunius]TWT51546.1 von Willebrand factor type A domain protein [Thalassoglobus neptunius]
MRMIEKGVPAAASLILHLMVVGIFAMMLLPASDSRELSTIVGNADVQEFPDMTVIADMNFGVEAESDRANQQRQAPPSFLQPASAPVTSAPRYEIAGDLPRMAPSNGTGSMSEDVGPLIPTGVLAKSGEGDGEGIGGAHFFGINLQGHSVVFVVDASKSMLHPFPGPTKTRFARVQMELLTSIQAMEETQRFFMILFNEHAYPMPSNQLADATTGAKKRYLHWMATAKPEGKTDPEIALLMALQLRPEVIYFLTDGDFKYRVVENVSKANVAKVSINCIGFGDDDGEKFLKELAARNGGSYRFIPEVEFFPESPFGHETSNRPKLSSRATEPSP